MNFLVFLLLLVAVATAAPLNPDTFENTYLVNYPVVNYPLQKYGYPFGYPYLDVYGRDGLTRQGVPGITVMVQQAAAALSNLQLYYTVKKWNTILCLLDSTCPTVVLPPTPPFGRK